MFSDYERLPGVGLLRATTRWETMEDPKAMEDDDCCPRCGAPITKGAKLCKACSNRQITWVRERMRTVRRILKERKQCQSLDQ